VDIRFSDDPGAFATLAAEFMKADPFSTNVIGVHSSGVVAGLRPRGPQDIWAVMLEQKRVIGVAMQTPPYNLFVSRMPAEAAHRLADAIDGVERAIPGVSGETTAVSAFLDRWAELCGEVPSGEVAMRMYRLGRLRHPSGVVGEARPAGRDDAGVIRDWFAAFQAEAQRDGPAHDAASIADRRIAAGEVTLWARAGEPVSMAACSPPACGVARVGPVYTPPAHRRHGFGAAVTAGATAQALEKGAVHVVLYTDLANPTSNSVYRSIGYLADHDAVERRFAGQ